jgi:hypothetical protein
LDRLTGVRGRTRPGGRAPWPPISLLIGRTRTIALATQVVLLFRNGYLPFPYVIGMLPFAALTLAGVADQLYKGPAARDLVRQGFNPNPVWFYKLDLDPAVRAKMPERVARHRLHPALGVHSDDAEGSSYGNGKRSSTRVRRKLRRR